MAHSSHSLQRKITGTKAFKRDELSGEYSQVGNRLACQDALFLGKGLAMSSYGSVIVAMGGCVSFASGFDFTVAFVVLKYNTETSVYDSIQVQVPNAAPFFGFPSAVALSGSGDEPLSAEGDFNQHLLPEGGITRLTRSSDGTYHQPVDGDDDKFTCSDQVGTLKRSVNFGASISVSADGKQLIVSASGDDVSKGAVYFFEQRTATFSPSGAPSRTPSDAPSGALQELRLMLLSIHLQTLHHMFPPKHHLMYLQMLQL